MKKILCIIISLYSWFIPYTAVSSSSEIYYAAVETTKNMNRAELANLMESYRSQVTKQIQEKKWSEFERSYFILSCVFIIQIEEELQLKGDASLNFSGIDELVYAQIDFMINLFENHEIPNDKFSFKLKLLRKFFKDFSKYTDNAKLRSIVNLICIDYMNALQAFLRFSKMNKFPPRNLTVLYPIYTEEEIRDDNILIKNGQISIREKYSVNGDYKYYKSNYSKHLSKMANGEFELRNIDTDLFLEFLYSERELSRITITNSRIDFSKITLTSSLKQLFLSNSEIKNLNFLYDLEYLGISNCIINGINIEKENRKLKGLSITHTNIKDVDFIKYLTSLEFLDLSYTKVCNLNSVSGLRLLNDLRFIKTNINNLNFINNKIPLKKIFFSYTDIDDISPLFTLNSLELVSMMFTKVSKSQYECLIKKVQTVDWNNAK